MKVLTLLLAVCALLLPGGTAVAGWTCVSGCSPSPDPAPPVCYSDGHGGRWCQY